MRTLLILALIIAVLPRATASETETDTRRLPAANRYAVAQGLSRYYSSRALETLPKVFDRRKQV